MTSIVADRWCGSIPMITRATPTSSSIRLRLMSARRAALLRAGQTPLEPQPRHGDRQAARQIRATPLYYGWAAASEFLPPSGNKLLNCADDITRLATAVAPAGRGPVISSLDGVVDYSAAAPAATAGPRFDPVKPLVESVTWCVHNEACTIVLEAAAEVVAQEAVAVAAEATVSWLVVIGPAGRAGGRVRRVRQWLRRPRPRGCELQIQAHAPDRGTHRERHEQRQRRIPDTRPGQVVLPGPQCGRPGRQEPSPQLQTRLVRHSSVQPTGHVEPLQRASARASGLRRVPVPDHEPSGQPVGHPRRPRTGAGYLVVASGLRPLGFLPQVQGGRRGPVPHPAGEAVGRRGRAQLRLPGRSRRD